MDSMTGIGRVMGKVGLKPVIVEIRSVNHRFCEVACRLPSRYLPLEGRFLSLIKKKIVRGKIDLWIGEEKGGGDFLHLNEKALKNYYRFLCTIRDKLKLTEPVGLGHLQGGFNFFMGGNGEIEDDWIPLKKLTEKALSILVQMRQKEGRHLRESLEKRLKIMDGFLEKISGRHEEVLNLYKTKLEERVKKILGGIEVDPAKLANEVVFYADRSDISEECERLLSHIVQLKKLILSSKPCGRTADFLIQEMNREWNTIASKSQDSSMAHLVVAAKSEMEKMREQIQNVE